MSIIITTFISLNGVFSSPRTSCNSYEHYSAGYANLLGYQTVVFHLCLAQTQDCLRSNNLKYITIKEARPTIKT